MFADGGVASGKSRRPFLKTSAGDIDATDLALEALPHLWRDRFYTDIVLHDVLARNIGRGTLPQALLQATERAFDKQPPTGPGGCPVIRRTGFEVRRNPDRPKRDWRIARNSLVITCPCPSENRSWRMRFSCSQVGSP